MVEKSHCLLFMERQSSLPYHKSLSLCYLLSQINPFGIILYVDFVKLPIFKIKTRNNVSGTDSFPVHRQSSSTPLSIIIESILISFHFGLKPKLKASLEGSQDS